MFFVPWSKANHPPQSAKVNWSHPLAKDLMWFVITDPTTGQGFGYEQHLDRGPYGHHLQAFWSGAGRVNTQGFNKPNGSAMYHRSEANSNIGSIIGTGPYTMAAEGGGQQTALFNAILTLDFFNAPGMSLCTDAANSGASPWGMYISGTKSANTTINLEQPYTFSASRRSTAANDLHFYLNGRHDGTSTDANTHSNASVDTIYMSSNSTVKKSFWSWGAIWSRELNALEQAQIHINPFVMLEQIPITFSAPAAAAGLPAAVAHHHRQVNIHVS